MGSDLGKGIQEFDKAILLLAGKKFNQGEAYYFRGVIYDAMGETRNAQADYAKAVDLTYIITAHDRRLDVPTPDVIAKIKAQYPNSNLGTPNWGPPLGPPQRKPGSPR